MPNITARFRGLAVRLGMAIVKEAKFASLLPFWGANQPNRTPRFFVWVGAFWMVMSALVVAGAWLATMFVGAKAGFRVDGLVIPESLKIASFIGGLSTIFGWILWVSAATYLSDLSHDCE